MSSFSVEVVLVDRVEPHPNADRLDLLYFKDWACIKAKGLHKPGDKVVYIPIDSILPAELEAKLFPIDSKVRLHNSRVKTIKLRGAISQGLVACPTDVGLSPNVKVGADVTKQLGITKYEPPTSAGPAAGLKSTSRASNPHFARYTGIENAKNHPHVFVEGEIVVVTEKIHGTNFRCGYVPFFADTLWKKLKQLFGFAPKSEFVYGSHNMQLQSKLLYKGYYDKNVYAEAVRQHQLEVRLKQDEVLYGEIYGDGIQKGYAYGCKPGERKLVVFDVKRAGVWLTDDELRLWCNKAGLDCVPLLFKGPYNKEWVLELRAGNSVLAPSQKTREGVVVRPVSEATAYLGRKMLKYINDEYLLKDQSDFH